MPRVQPEIKRRFRWPHDPDGASIVVKHVKDARIQAIVARHNLNRTTLDQKNKTVSVTEQKNPEAVRNEIAIDAIDSWEHFFDASGKEVPCAKETIALFCEEDGFVAQLNKFRHAVACIAKARKRKTVKNL